ncbi:uncharacterized protein LOC113133090 [Mastacembelus armatus]|uniref:uncharacterized protein LOC113133090 n=1 Tax=Mastacembelus armatus TaxID=205130 RepID=UPI000E454B41|nr:uncharacterized protein LOC113133090 [Mastacembelus armatus]
MQLVFFSLILTGVHVSVLVDCRPRIQDPEQRPQHLQNRFHTGPHSDMAVVVLPVPTDVNNYVSIFGLRGKCCLCMDLKGELFNSRQRDKGGCLFQDSFGLTDLQHMFYSTSWSQLLKMARDERRTTSQQPPEPSSTLLKTFLGPLVKRRRRSEEVNPSDPLRSQPHLSHSAKDHKDTFKGQRQHDQTGAVSKETITSCDDPLRVLQPNLPVSPVKTNIADRAEQE